MTLFEIKLDNILCFDGFHLDLANDNHSNYVIISGDNAAGKTSLVKVIREVFYFIRFGKQDSIYNLINDYKQNAFISVIFLTNAGNLCEFKILVNSLDINKHFNIYYDAKLSLQFEKMGKDFDYYKCKKNLMKKSCNDFQSKSEYLDKVKIIRNEIGIFDFNHTKDDKNLSNFLRFVLTDVGPEILIPEDTKFYAATNYDFHWYYKNIKLFLSDLLKKTDRSVLSIEIIDTVENTFVIRTTYKDYLIHNLQIGENFGLSNSMRDIIKYVYLVMNMYFQKDFLVSCDEEMLYLNQKLLLECADHLGVFTDNCNQLFLTDQNGILNEKRNNFILSNPIFIKLVRNKDGKIICDYSA